MTPVPSTPARDRAQAGRYLAALLEHGGVAPSVVAAVTAGAVPMATTVAAYLHARLALVLARPLRSRWSEAPFGAVDGDGHCVLDYPAVVGLRLDTAEIEVAREHERPLLAFERAFHALPPLRSFLPAQVVVLVQDGVEDGLLMDAAVSHALQAGAENVVVATPWATARAMSRFTGREHVSIVCCWTGERRHGPGQAALDLRLPASAAGR
jgi:putative phosphoribosyl transferase